MKIAILLIFLFIFYNLGRSLFYLVKDGGKSTRTVSALTWRIGLSVGLFALVILGAMMGWIQPHALPTH